MGIGTLIIFIAVILVAAIAAAVLLGTGGKLQQTALKTGEETRAAIATGAEIVTVSAQNGNNSNVENFTLMMRLNPGSDSMKLESTVIRLDTKNTTQELTYGASGCTGNQTHYCIDYVKEGPGYKDGYLTKGDFIKITLDSQRSIIESETIRLRFVPRTGQTTALQFVTPAVIKDVRIYLYP